MAELSKDFDSLLVDTVGETLEGGNHIVGGYGGLTRMGLALKVYIAVFRDDQADFAVLGPFPVVFAYGIGRIAVLVRLCGGHRGHHQAVGQVQFPNHNGIRQVCHKDTPP